MKLKTEIKNLKDEDIYSLILFALFKLRDVPEYAILSELIYVLNKNEFLKLCEYFGGMTIKIPTIDELEHLLNLLMIYQSVNIDKNSLEDTLKMLKYNKQKTNKLEQDYVRLTQVLDKYKLLT